MLEQIMKKKTSRMLIAALLGTVMITALTMWGCGGSGTSSYDDPSATTINSPAIITAATLKQWVDGGLLNAAFGGRDRVVVVSVSSTADWTAKGHIPGAVRLDTTEIATNRIEGLAIAGSMMPSGPMMDVFVQRLGIDANTTIVITIPKCVTSGSNGNFFQQSVAFWDFRYWGFARNRLKILNGGDDAWDVAGLALSTDPTDKFTASTYSVSNNPALKNVVRLSLSEIIARVDALIATPALKSQWQMVETLGTTVTPYMTNAFRSVATQFLTRLNGDATKNWVYPDQATLIARLATIPVDDSGAAAFVSPTKNTICMCQTSTSASPTFVLFDAVLNVPEGNIAMYDGSKSQWSVYSLARLTAAFPNATTAQKNAWAFDVAGAGIRAQGALPASTDLSIWVGAPVLPPSDPAMNQIESADKAYIAPAAATTSPGGSSSGNTPGGGC
jgi:3-mercaptopyruvate sulfurtransferase SseA